MPACTRPMYHHCVTTKCISCHDSVAILPRVTCILVCCVPRKGEKHPHWCHIWARLWHNLMWYALDAFRKELVKTTELTQFLWQTMEQYFLFFLLNVVRSCLVNSLLSVTAYNLFGLTPNRMKFIRRSMTISLLVYFEIQVIDCMFLFKWIISSSVFNTNFHLKALAVKACH